jgi:hypothetical protein
VVGTAIRPSCWRERRHGDTQTSKTAASAGARRTRRTGRCDPLAVRLLKKDHREVEGWFDEYEQLGAEAEKLDLFNRIALALKARKQKLMTELQRPRRN